MDGARAVVDVRFTVHRVAEDEAPVSASRSCSPGLDIFGLFRPEIMMPPSQHLRREPSGRELRREPPSEPRRLGPYEVVGTLGAGGMGTVYLCRDASERLFAVKVLHPSPDPVRRRRFEREARVVAKLDHPGIVRVHEVGRQDGRAFIAMEKLEGRTLAERLADGPLPAPLAIDYARQLAEALAAAHAEGIVHRDLKPANVMVSPDDSTLTLLDFGVAALVQDEQETLSGSDTDLPLTRDGAQVGTLAFMAPEQLLGEPADERTDIFALGCLLHTMLAGSPPFAATHPALTAHKILQGGPPPLDLPTGPLQAALEATLASWLARRPEDRPASMAGVATELEDLAQHLLPRQTPKRRLTSRLARGLAALAGVGLVLALFSATDLWTRDAPPRDQLPRDQPRRSEAALERDYRDAIAALDRPDVDGQLDRAESILRRLSAEKPEWAEPWAARSRLELLRYRTAGRDALYLDRSRAAAERAALLAPDLAVARAALGRALVAAGEHDLALPHLQRARSLDPREPEALRGLGELYSARGQLDESLDIYRQAVAAHPEDAGLLNRLGSLHFRRGEDEEARAAFERSVELAPDSIYGYRNLAAIHHRQGRISEAAAALEKALEIRPSATLFANLGTLRYYQGLYEDAAAHFEKALAGDGGGHSPLRWANLGDALRQIPRRADEAEAAYRRSAQLARQWLERHPGDQVERSRLAQVEAKRGRCDEAAEVMARIDLDKADEARDGSVAYRLALASELCGHRQQALDRLARAVAAGHPLDAVAREPELVDLRADVRYHRWLASLEG